ncbi:MAG: hypothetical protein ACW97P_12195 [Candidatus Hodarchaeales archaeon]|jgi:hypothetical protein
MSKYLNLKLALDSESVNIYIETGGEPVHVVYWHLDEWIEDAESSVPAALNAVDLFHTNPDELIDRLVNVNVPDVRDKLITPEEMNKFLVDWGQTHQEICCCLGYDEDDSDDMIMGDDYFWYEEKQLWCNKGASGFEGKDQLIADYLQYIQS